jgi:hypothetical protein
MHLIFCLKLNKNILHGFNRSYRIDDRAGGGRLFSGDGRGETVVMGGVKQSLVDVIKAIMVRCGFRSSFVSTEENAETETRYVMQPLSPCLPILAIIGWISSSY